MSDRRTKAAEQRALALLVIERNRLREAVADAEDALEFDREYARICDLPPRYVAASERRLALLRLELAELTPGRRPSADAIPTEEVPAR